MRTVIPLALSLALLIGLLAEIDAAPRPRAGPAVAWAAAPWPDAAWADGAGPVAARRPPRAPPYVPSLHPGLVGAFEVLASLLGLAAFAPRAEASRRRAR
jgi:hypothetical protein